MTKLAIEHKLAIIQMVEDLCRGQEIVLHSETESLNVDIDNCIDPSQFRKIEKYCADHHLTLAISGFEILDLNR